TKMRVLMRREAYADPCVDIDLGEVEDYTVIISDGAAANRAVLALQGNKEGRQARLNWTTNTEFKNDYFVIERSADGQQYEVIGEVDSREATEHLREYSWIDPQPMEGENLYRIRQVFHSGQSTLTNKVMLAFDELIPLNLYPNPATEFTWLDLSRYAGQPVRLTIVNTLGVAVQTIEIDEADEAPLRLDLSRYSNGAYTVFIQSDEKPVSRKLIISRTY
ncbi:MAG: T9SS type A sorting domain-containing protein, partial [Bacteroidota bacterium]